MTLQWEESSVSKHLFNEVFCISDYFYYLKHQLQINSASLFFVTSLFAIMYFMYVICLLTSVNESLLDDTF